MLVHVKRFCYDNDVRLLFAVEGGSRARGVADKNSDCDVRFVYGHPPVRYVGLGVPKEAAHWFEGEIDLVGWDVRKFMQLVRKGNVTALNWTSSHLVYWGRREQLELRDFALAHFDKNAYCAHQLGVVSKYWHKYIRTGKSTPKRHWIAGVAILSAIVARRLGTPAPLWYPDLLDTAIRLDVPVPTTTLLALRQGRYPYSLSYLESYEGWLKEALEEESGLRGRAIRQPVEPYNRMLLDMLMRLYPMDTAWRLVPSTQRASVTPGT